MHEHPRTRFLLALERSRLVSPERLRQAQSMVERAPDLEAQDLAEWLVLVGDLTAWQAERLLEGTFVFHLGKYKLLDLLGQGGMGAVFKAEHAVMGRLVALKVLFKARLDSPTALGRFRREVKALAALNHPNIVTAHDAGQVNDTHFLVMEYVGGADLNDWQKRFGRIPYPLACEFIRQAALGLEHAWQSGLVHRDVKPANLLVSWPGPGTDPVVKVLDLGLARFCDDGEDEGRAAGAAAAAKDHPAEAGLTQYGNIVGTPDYLSPEQIRGGRDVDIRSDVFSLGCTLFKLLSGVSPFGGKTLVEKLHLRTQTGGPPAARLSSVVEGVPAGLDEMLAVMLARSPHDRFQSPLEAASALAEFGGVGPDDWDHFGRHMVGSSASRPPIAPPAALDDAEATADEGVDSHGQSTQWLKRLGGDIAVQRAEDDRSPAPAPAHKTRAVASGSEHTPVAVVVPVLAGSTSSSIGSSTVSSSPSGSSESRRRLTRSGVRRGLGGSSRMWRQLRRTFLIFVVSVTVTLLLGLWFSGRLKLAGLLRGEGLHLGGAARHEPSPAPPPPAPSHPARPEGASTGG